MSNHDSKPIINSYLAQLDSEEFSFSEAVGGWRGLLEATAPGILFVIVYIISRELIPPLVAAVTVTVITMVIRLVRRQTLRQVLVGAIGVAIGVLWALHTGQIEDYFVFGLWVNGLYAVGSLLSIVVRFPFVGIVGAALLGTLSTWRDKTPLNREFYQRSMWASWVWVAVFVVRLLIQVPMYLAGWVSALGIARLVLGVPLLAVAAWLTWVLMRDIFTTIRHTKTAEAPPAGDD